MELPDRIELMLDKFGIKGRFRLFVRSISFKIINKIKEVTKSLYLEDEALYNAVRHLLGRGKLIRGIFSYIVGKGLGGDDEQLLTLSVASELYHTASLIHDDIIDDSDYRRGVESVHKKYGVDRAIIAGDLLIIYPNILLSKLGPEVIRIFASSGIQMCDGEALEYTYMLSGGGLDIETYNKIVYKKTASFFEGIMESIGVIVDKGFLIPSLKALGRYIGMAYQYRDDILDFSGDPRIMGKPIGKDYNKPNLVRVLKESLDMSDSDALSYAYRLIDRYVENSIAIIDDMPIEEFYSSGAIIMVKSLARREL